MNRANQYCQVLATLFLMALSPHAWASEVSSILLVDCYRDDRASAQSTVAVALSSEIIVTTYHGLAPASAAFVNRGRDGDVAIASVLHSDPLLDFVVARLQTPLINVQGARVSESHPASGATVKVASRNPLGQITHREASIEQVSVVGLAETLLVSNRSAPGESGSAILDNNDRLLAIAIRSGSNQADPTICVPAYRIRIALNATKDAAGITLADWHRQQSGPEASTFWNAVNAGQLAGQQNNAKESERHYRIALAANPKNVVAANGLLASLVYQGVPIEQASQTIDGFVAQAGGEPHMAWLGAYLHLHAGKGDIQELESVRVRLSMPEIQYWTASAIFTRHPDKADVAIELLKEGRAKWPEFNANLESLAIFSQHAKDPVAEMAYRKQLIQNNPQSVDHYIELARCVRRTGDTEGAMAVVQMLHAVNAFAANRLAREMVSPSMQPK